MYMPVLGDCGGTARPSEMEEADPLWLGSRTVGLPAARPGLPSGQVKAGCPAVERKATNI